MNRRARATRHRPGVAVCVCWFHPLVLSDCRRLLSGNGLRVHERRLDADAIRAGTVPRFPRASVYVVEGLATGALTEAVVAMLAARAPNARLLVVGEAFDQMAAFSLLRLGVKGLLRFEDAPASLRRAVKELVVDGFWVSRSLLSRFVASTVSSRMPAAPSLMRHQAQLSRRESEVCGLLLENLSNREIAGRLKVTERTAKFHVANLLAKYGLKRRSELVVLSYSGIQADRVDGPLRQAPSRVRAG